MSDAGDRAGGMEGFVLAYRRRRLAALVLAAIVVSLPAGVARAVGPFDLELPTGLRISGTIEDAHGAPVEGADVMACVAVDDCAVGDTLSAADGSFSIRGLVGGSYFIEAQPPEGANLLSSWHTGTPGGSHVAADAVAVDLAIDVTGIDLHLPDGLRIIGHTKSPEGDPVGGVNVYASGSSGSPVPSAADGAFEVVGLEPGTFGLQVSPPDGEYPGGWLANGTVEASSDDATQVEVVDADVDIGDVTLFRGRTISGHVTRPADSPVDVVALEASVEYRAHVDASGNFTVRSLYPGAYHLLFEVPETGAFFDDQFPYGLYNGQGKTLAPQTAAGVAVDVTVANAAGISAVVPKLARIQGTVTDVAGPVAGAGVRLCDPDLGCAASTTDTNGRFAARNTPPGSYTIQAGAAHHVVVAYAAGRTIPDGFAGTPITVGTAGVSGISIVLPIGGSIVGRITGAGDVPAMGVNVAGSPLSGGIWEFGPGGAVTAADGAFSVGGLVDGDYHLAASPPQNADLRGGYWSEGGWTTDDDTATTIQIDDAVPPTVVAPSVSLRAGAQLGTSTVPVRIGWTASDPGSGISEYRVQQQTNGGSWATVSSPLLAGMDRSYAPSSTTTRRVRVRAEDFSDNVSGDLPGATFRVIRTEQSAKALTWHGTWSTTSSASASGRSYRRSTAAGASATYRFSGRSIGWVARVGASFGRARVYVDGALAATVDLAQPASSRRIVFAKTWTSSSTHTIRIVNLATHGRPTIDVDAFVVVR